MSWKSMFMQDAGLSFLVGAGVSGTVFFTKMVAESKTSFKKDLLYSTVGGIASSSLAQLVVKSSKGLSNTDLSKITKNSRELRFVYITVGVFGGLVTNMIFSKDSGEEKE